MEQLNVIAVTQARTNSSRLPGKILKSINGKTLLEIHINRIRTSKKINKLIVATTTNESDNLIISCCNNLNVASSRGSETDVLDRFYQAVKNEKPTHVVRLTSDCPLIDSKLIDEVIEFSIVNKLDYCSNIMVEDFPDGEDIEVITFAALESAWKNAKENYQREHVTPYIRENSTFMGGTLFKSDNYPAPKKYGHVRLTVDEYKDFEVIEELIQSLGTDKTWMEYADYYLTNPAIASMNAAIKRNEGFKKA